MEGSRTDRFLQVSYRPGSESFNVIILRGGFVAEMLGQTAAHCGTLRDELRVPNADDDSDTFACRDWQRVCRPAGLLAVTSASAVIDAELTDERERLISSASIVVQLVKDFARYT